MNRLYLGILLFGFSTAMYPISLDEMPILSLAFVLGMGIGLALIISRVLSNKDAKSDNNTTTDENSGDKSKKNIEDEGDK